MSRRRAVLLFGLLLSAAALAGSAISGNPGHFRPDPERRLSALRSLEPARATLRRASSRPAHGRAREEARLSAPVIGLRAVALDGVMTEIPLPDGLDLSDPLPVPETPIAELEIDLGGPLTVSHWTSGTGRFSKRIDLPTLTIVVEDPDTSAEIGAVIVDLPLELGRGFVQGLMGPGALADAVTAVAW